MAREEEGEEGKQGGGAWSNGESFWSRRQTLGSWSVTQAEEEG
jgi:hypothetical protein